MDIHSKAINSGTKPKVRRKTRAVFLRLSPAAAEWLAALTVEDGLTKAEIINSLLLGLKPPCPAPLKFKF